MKISKLYFLAILLPLAVFSIEYPRINNDFDLFKESFVSYTKVRGIVNSVDCSNHNYVAVTHDDVIYTRQLPYTFPSCRRYKVDDPIDIYISDVNSKLVTTRHPSNVIKEYEYQISTIWYVFLFFGIPIALSVRLFQYLTNKGNSE